MAVRALVTGAGGFLGQAIVRQLLERGDQVRGFSRRRYAQLEQWGVQMVQGDVRNLRSVAAACQGVDVVFHTAAVAGIWGAWQHYYGINVLGTENVLAGCRQHGVQRLVYTSSPSVTFDGGDQAGVDEQAPYATHWLCHYSYTKALAEQQVLAASGSDLLTCALRPHLIWGPGDTQLIPRLIQRARRGRLRRVGDGSNLVDMIYIDNAAEAHLRATDALQASSQTAGRAYFISQGEPVNCWQWIDEILALAGLAPVQKSISLKAAWRMGHALELLYAALRLRSEPPMTRFLAAQLAKSHYFDISAARRDLGYEPRVSTAEGMRALGNWLPKSP